MSARVAVVGAGLAGLAAATALTDRGCEVVLLERSRLLGGKASSFTAGGVEYDTGQHVHLACCTEYVGWVARLGLGEALWLQPRFEVVMLRAGRPPARLRAACLPAPLHLAASFARLPAIRPRARLQVLHALLAARCAGGGGTTALGWLRRHGQGDEALHGFWEPFIVPALNARLDEADAEALLFTVRTAFLGGAGTARIGWSRVPLARIAQAAADRLAEVRTGAPVAGLLEGGSGHVLGVRLLDGETVGADAVVLAVPPRRAARILGDPQRFGVQGLADFRHAPIVDVHLWYEGLDGAWPWDFAALGASPVQWVFRKAPGYLCCSLSAAGEVLALPEAGLVRLAHLELAAAVPALRGRTPRAGRAVRDPEATFIPTPGLRRPPARTLAPNLVLAGAWTDTGWPATMESAVRSGHAAAQALGAVGEVTRRVA